MNKIEDLIPGKVYQCFNAYNKKHQFYLRWGDSEIEVRDFEKSSIFIFLKIMNNESGCVTIKGIVAGKVLYTARCGENDIIFMELINNEKY